MTSTEASTPAVAGERSRAQLQRERILDAAEKCFIDSGFHGASMAHIATTAGISAGLIYRYFPSKATIVQAIIERHLEGESHAMIRRPTTVEEVTATVLDVFERWRRNDDPKMNAALMLELSAEASRDPEIAKVVQAKDHLLASELTQMVRRVAQQRGVTLTPAASRARAVMLQCLVEGLAQRAVRDPQLKRSVLKPMLEQVIGVLLS